MGTNDAYAERVSALAEIEAEGESDEGINGLVGYVVTISEAVAGVMNHVAADAFVRFAVQRGLALGECVRRYVIFAGAAAVDSRMTSSGSMAISEGYSFCPSIRSSKLCAATSPMRFSGWRTVVKLGV